MKKLENQKKRMREEEPSEPIQPKPKKGYLTVQIKGKPMLVLPSHVRSPRLQSATSEAKGQNLVKNASSLKQFGFTKNTSGSSSAADPKNKEAVYSHSTTGYMK